MAGMFSVALVSFRLGSHKISSMRLSNDPGKVDGNFFCYAATVLSPHRNVLIFTQRVHKPFIEKAVYAIKCIYTPL